MKTNIYDTVVEKTLNRIEKVSDRIAANFKGVTPFNKERMPTKDLLNAYQSLTPEDMNSFIQTYGRDTVNNFISEMEMLKQKQGGQG